MSEFCSCDTSGGNTGLPSCYSTFGVAKQPIFVNYRDSDGNINRINESDLVDGKLTQEFFESKIRATDPSKRWYILPEFKNVEGAERGDDIVETFEDGTTSFIQEGPRTFNGIIVNGDPVLLGNIKSWRCKEGAYFMIDNKGNLIGESKITDGFINPVLIQDESLSGGLILQSDTTKQKVRVSFTVSTLMNDANMRMIEASKITADIKGAGGLIDARENGVTNVTTAGFQVQLDTEFGGLTSRVPATGLSETAFRVYNVTQSAVVATVVTEDTDTDGLYSFVYGAPVTAGDVIRITNTNTGTSLPSRYSIITFTVNTPT